VWGGVTLDGCRGRRVMTAGFESFSRSAQSRPACTTPYAATLHAAVAPCPRPSVVATATMSATRPVATKRLWAPLMGLEVMIIAALADTGYVAHVRVHGGWVRATYTRAAGVEAPLSVVRAQDYAGTSRW
jgi:hypothetical protein